MKKLAIFASGSGTNAENLIRYFAKHESIRVSLLVCNKADAPVLKVAERLGVPSLLVSKEQWGQPDSIVKFLHEQGIDFIVLAGFLWLIPKELILAFPNKIINIHPALLPKYGGKGMYGAKVHEAVFQNKENESGITIHLVNEVYDAGEIIFQRSFPIEIQNDTPATIAQKIHELEYTYFPVKVEEYVLKSS